jgi:hypothetical protein
MAAAGAGTGVAVGATGMAVVGAAAPPTAATEVAEAYYMALPSPLFYLFLVVFIILLCILSVLMNTGFI